MRNVSRWCFCVALAGCKDEDGKNLDGVDGPGELPEDPYIDAPCDQLTVARTCPDCDVRIDWSAVTTDWWGDDIDLTTISFASIGAWDPPIDDDLVIRAYCKGAAIEAPEEPPVYFRELTGPSVVLGDQLPRITVDDRMGVFYAGNGQQGIVALLFPDPESTNDRVELQ